LIGERGIVQLLNGEYRAAVEDFSRVADVVPLPEFLYYRACAYEKLGETELALADYSAAIDFMEKIKSQKTVAYFTHRIPETDIQPQQWYDVTLDELKTLRDELQENLFLQKTSR
jgi:tetratricopeptide (TPR) repeat protein